MDSILQQLNSVPGVIGSLVCGSDGSVVAQAFPPLFDVAIIEGISAAVADPAASFRSAAGTAEFFDFRYADGRVVIKPLQNAYLLLLCTKGINLPALAISLNVAKGKLESLMAGSPDASAGADAGTPGVLSLTVCHLADEAKVNSFEQFGMVALTPATARQISSVFKEEAFKKLKLSNRSTGVSGVFPVMIVNESDASYDGKIILCISIEKKLGAAPGDSLIVEIP